MNRHDERQSQPRAQIEQQPAPRALPLSNEELRRQLGWGLIEVTRELAPMSGSRQRKDNW